MEQSFTFGVICQKGEAFRGIYKSIMVYSVSYPQKEHQNARFRVHSQYDKLCDGVQGDLITASEAF